MEFRRYAIYHLPEGALGRMGTAWLGWDPRRGSPAARPVVRGLPGDAEALTLAPVELVREPIGRGGVEPHEIEQLADPRRPTGAVPAVHVQWLPDDLPGPHPRVE